MMPTQQFITENVREICQMIGISVFFWFLSKMVLVIDNEEQ